MDSFRNRILRWAGRKFHRRSDRDGAEPSSTLPQPVSTASHARHPGQGLHVIGIHPASGSDPLRLRFEITPLSIRPLSSDNPPALSKPYPPAVSVAHVDLLGTVHSANTHVKRDLGFHGRLGTYILLTYGDTLYADAAYSDTWRGMTSDSVALATHDPQVVVDPLLNRAGYPEQFCPLDSSRGEIPSEYALGITNVVSTATTTANVTNVDVDSLAVVNNLDTSGVLFFLLNHRPGGANHILGAGVATVTLDRSTYPPTPRIRRLPPPPSQPHQQYCHWWDGATEPWWGDICALRWADYIYAYGHGGEGNPWVYVARAPASQATRLECYEYWNGEDWQTERLRTTAIGDKESVFWQINQGQVVYSEYFGCFFFVYCDNFMNSRVHLKTARRPEGPWSEPPIMLYQATPLLTIEQRGCIYAAVPHPYFDESGKSLVVTFTNHPNTIQVVKIVF